MERKRALLLERAAWERRGEWRPWTPTKALLRGAGVAVSAASLLINYMRSRIVQVSILIGDANKERLVETLVCTVWLMRFGGRNQVEKLRDTNNRWRRVAVVQSPVGTPTLAPTKPPPQHCPGHDKNPTATPP